MMHCFGGGKAGGATREDAELRKRSASETDRLKDGECSDGQEGTEVLGRLNTLVIGWYKYLPGERHGSSKRERQLLDRTELKRE